MFVLAAVCGLTKTASATDAPVIRYLFSFDKFFQDRFNTPMGLFIDKEREEIYVADRGRDDVFIFDTAGTPIFKFGRAQGISRPVDLVVKHGFIYLAQEGKSYIEVFNYRGEAVKKVAPPDGMPFSPGRMVLDDDGSIYVANTAKPGCVVFDKDDMFSGVIGENLLSLSGVAVSRERVYMITPFDGRAVHVYDKKGGFIMAFEGISERGGTLGLPVAAMTDENGHLWLVDALIGIVVYDRNGNQIGRFDEFEKAKGRLLFSIDIDFDKENMLYISEKAGKRISVFKIEN